MDLNEALAGLKLISLVLVGQQDKDDKGILDFWDDDEDFDLPGDHEASTAQELQLAQF